MYKLNRIPSYILLTTHRAHSQTLTMTDSTGNLQWTSEAGSPPLHSGVQPIYTQQKIPVVEARPPNNAPSFEHVQLRPLWRLEGSPSHEYEPEQLPSIQHWESPGIPAIFRSPLKDNTHLGLHTAGSSKIRVTSEELQSEDSLKYSSLTDLAEAAMMTDPLRVPETLRK